ncbi:esterase/lipase family protein [Benzoatithermus flavus]|uniref:Alpha/beta fold hydrolase n=1 Tax=Benzoatithermus flavus TaxID=3108223 RepID=A0ABU8XM81_9PROT
MIPRSWRADGAWRQFVSAHGSGCAVAVVLVHGYLCMSRSLYWQGLLPLRCELAVRGCSVVGSCQPRTGPVAARARRLASFLDALPYRRLILIGHSMGGLDARYAASRLDPEHRISHVVTIGTPHRGTAVADWALRDTVWLTRFARCIDRGALLDLSLEGAERLNAAMPDREDVGYVSLAGICPADRLGSTFRRMAERVMQDEGPNDGVVSLRSAMRGPLAVSIRANHLELIGHRMLGGVATPEASRSVQPVSVLRALLRRILADAVAEAVGPSRGRGQR